MDNPASPSRQPKGLRILVVRPDRIGDVVLSTPVLEVLKRHYPRSHLTVMVRAQVAPLIRGIPGVDDVMIFDPEGVHRGFEGFFRLIAEIRERQFRIAVTLQTDLKISAALFGAGVRYRVGPLSRIHSFLFFNRGVRQRRSQVEMHEADYNLQLLRRLGIRVGTRNVGTRIALPGDAVEGARQWFLKQGCDPSIRESALIAVHPGMGGSALNWPEAYYVEFIRALLREGHRVVVTGGPGEGSLLGRIADQLGTVKDRALFYGGPGTGPIDALAGVLGWVDVVVAPSTGPLHVAVALGKPVVGFYPPIRVQSALRWGPYTADEARASVLVPEVYCGQDFRCKGQLCNYYLCMKSLTVTQALEEVHRQIAAATPGEAGQPRVPSRGENASHGETKT